jgi:DNA-binding CsgD family transcriptional regulator
LGQAIAAEHTIHALDSLFQALSYPGKREQELDFYHILTQFYKDTGDVHKVIAFQQASMNLSDSLYTAQLERGRRASAELIQYKARQFSQELNQEKQEARYHQQKARSRFWILVLFVFFLLSAGLLVTISLRQRLRLARKAAELNEAERKLSEAHAKAVEQEKMLLDVALQHKSKDVSDLALNAMIKKEWAKKLDGLLSQAEQSRGHMRSIALRKLREEIRSHIHADHSISQLHQNIETLNAEFYDHLNKQNPDLSKTEVRLVSFLKLRLSNDEIAMLQGISTKSVIMSRYRLKKKLALPESADLDTFCQKL